MTGGTGEEETWGLWIGNLVAVLDDLDLPVRRKSD